MEQLIKDANRFRNESVQKRFEEFVKIDNKFEPSHDYVYRVRMWNIKGDTYTMCATRGNLGKYKLRDGYYVLSIEYIDDKYDAVGEEIDDISKLATKYQAQSKVVERLPQLASSKDFLEYCMPEHIKAQVVAVLAAWKENNAKHRNLFGEAGVSPSED